MCRKYFKERSPFTLHVSWKEILSVKFSSRSSFHLCRFDLIFNPTRKGEMHFSPSG